MATEKQQEVAKILLENTGMAVSKAMEEVGYAPGTAKNPQQLTRSKGWKELMDEYLPDDLLAEKHKSLLTIKTKVRHYKKGDLETEVEELNTEAIGKGLDMAYKLKGKYAAEKMQITTSYDDMTDEELAAETALLEAKYKQRHETKNQEGTEV